MRKAKTFFQKYEREILFKYPDKTVCLDTPFYVLKPTDLKTWGNIGSGSFGLEQTDVIFRKKIKPNSRFAFHMCMSVYKDLISPNLGILRLRGYKLVDTFGSALLLTWKYYLRCSTSMRLIYRQSVIMHSTDYAFKSMEGLKKSSIDLLCLSSNRICLL